MNTDLTPEKLLEHFTHQIVIAKYGEENVSLECETCNEVLADADIEVKSSNEWIKELKDGITIMDPDGWDRKNYQLSMAEIITRREFERRFMLSTVSMPIGGSIWK